MKTYFYLFCFATIMVSAQLEIRDRCGPRGKGTCVLVDGCPSAVDQLKARRKHNLERCGWQGKYEIVCCMDNLAESRDPFAVRKSVEACKKFGQTAASDADAGIYIINGRNASLGVYPHMAAVGFDSNNRTFPYNWNCAGSLISENYVLTAAHCMVRALPVMIRLGKIDLYGNEDKADPQDIPVAENIPHPNYDYLKKTNDVALIRLSRNAVITANVQPICLYTESDVPVGLTITGWGVTEVDPTKEAVLSRFLQEAPVEPVDMDTCNTTLLNSPSKRPVLHTQLCALGRGPNITDTCQGDSGGPIQVGNRKLQYGTNYLLVGVTSFGKACASSTPGIYTKVYSYLEWIESNVWG